MGKTDRVKQCTKYRRKRRFCGNRFTNKMQEETVVDISMKNKHLQMKIAWKYLLLLHPMYLLPLSFEKIQCIETSTPKKNYPKLCGYRIVSPTDREHS